MAKVEIDIEKIPCPDARRYLRSYIKKKTKKGKKKSRNITWLEKWF